MVSNVFILDKNLKTKLILSINGHNTFFKDLYDLDLSTGTESYEFSTTAEDINESDYIMFHYHGDYKLFQIIDIEQEHREGKIITSVYGESACLELLNGVTDPIMNEEGKALSMTAGEFIDRVLTRSDWQRKKYSSSLDNKVVDVKIEKTRQIWPVIQEYMKEFGYEITTRVKYENGYVKKKYIDVYAEGELGNKTCKRFEYNRNVKGIVKKKNLYDFCTALILETKQDTQGIMYGIKDGNVLKPKDGIIKGPDANAVCAVDNNKIYNAGKDWIYGVYEDNDSGSGTEAVEKAVEELKRRSVPKFDYECDTAVSYKEYENINIGDTVYVIDHTFNPIITLEARVGKLEISFTDRDNCKCTLSNYKEIKTRITADDSHIKELLDKTTIQYGDKDKGQDEITLKDDYLDTKEKVDELLEYIKNLKPGGFSNPTRDRLIFTDDEDIAISSIGPHDEYNDRVSTWIGDNSHDIALGIANTDGETAHMPIVICNEDVIYGQNEYGEDNIYYEGLNIENPTTWGLMRFIHHDRGDDKSNASRIYATYNTGTNNDILYIEGQDELMMSIGNGNFLRTYYIEPEYIAQWWAGHITEVWSNLEIYGDIHFMGNHVNNYGTEWNQIHLNRGWVGPLSGKEYGDYDSCWVAENIDIFHGRLSTYLNGNYNKIYNSAFTFNLEDLVIPHQGTYTTQNANEGMLYSNMSYDSDEVRWCHKENVFTYAESEIDPETDQWVYTGRYICYVELPIYMALSIQNDYHINICKKSWGDYRIIEQDPYYFILESQEDNFAFTFEVVAKLTDHCTLDNNAIIANTGYTTAKPTTGRVTEEANKEVAEVNQESKVWKHNKTDED